MLRMSSSTISTFAPARSTLRSLQFWIVGIGTSFARQDAEAIKMPSCDAFSARGTPGPRVGLSATSCVIASGWGREEYQPVLCPTEVRDDLVQRLCIFLGGSPEADR